MSHPGVRSRGQQPDLQALLLGERLDDVPDGFEDLGDGERLVLGVRQVVATAGEFDDVARDGDEPERRAVDDAELPALDVVDVAALSTPQGFGEEQDGGQRRAQVVCELDDEFEAVRAEEPRREVLVGVRLQMRAHAFQVFDGREHPGRGGRMGVFGPVVQELRPEPVDETAVHGGARLVEVRPPSIGGEALLDGLDERIEERSRGGGIELLGPLVSPVIGYTSGGGPEVSGNDRVERPVCGARLGAPGRGVPSCGRIGRAGVTVNGDGAHSDFAVRMVPRWRPCFSMSRYSVVRSTPAMRAAFDMLPPERATSQVRYSRSNSEITRSRPTWYFSSMMAGENVLTLRGGAPVSMNGMSSGWI